MKISEIAPAVGYPHVQEFLTRVLDDQFADVRAMLKLPLPEAGIDAGCNFAVVSTLCNLISGISVTIYKPPDTLGELRTRYWSGTAFKHLVRDFFPRSELIGDDLPAKLYGLCRNPLAHSVGVLEPGSPAVRFVKVFHGDRRSGWTENELADLESGRFNLCCPTIAAADGAWSLHCDGFYFDTVEMVRRLVASREQVEAAEQRFRGGVYNWRDDPGRGRRKRV